MKKLLIISPYFPPANAADMQRIRMSLPYFKELGWEAEIVMVENKYLETTQDSLLLQTIPKDIIIHKVKAFSKKWTGKLGLGSIALRSLWFYKKRVNQLLKNKKYDLVYFSTTQFPVCILGAYWKSKFGIPYVIDMQDPWHSEYYQNKPKNEQPPKYWFSYRLNKWLEPIAMKNVDGIIAVSQAYISTLQERYKRIKEIPFQVITFGAFETDFGIAKQNQISAPPILQKKSNHEISIGYIGRGGYDMHDALEILFDAFKRGLELNPEYFQRIRFYFMGTSYAKNGVGIPTIAPLAERMGLAAYVEETTNRLPFYQTLNTLKSFDVLFICGSNDEKYTASKIYPYILAEKPLLSIFHPKSSAAQIIKDCKAGKVVTFDENGFVQTERILDYLENFKELYTPYIVEAFASYSAKEMTRKQCELFNKVIP